MLLVVIWVRVQRTRITKCNETFLFSLHKITEKHRLPYYVALHTAI